MNKSENRIVIRRKRRVHAVHHGGSWKIAYADFMTAMMAFFLVMWLISLVPKKDLQAIAEYFRMPLMEAITGGRQNDSAKTVIPGGSPSIIPNPNPIPTKGDVHAAGDSRDKQRLQNLKADIEQLIKVDPVLQQFRPQLLLDMTPDGLRIQIIDKYNRPMFTTGSAQVQPYMRDILQVLGPAFNEIPNSISVTGHTDAVQYATGEREYSNWELSADRANAARKELVLGGMNELKIKRILGMSSSVSLIKDNPTAAVNRRISIVVLNRRAERHIDEQNASGATAFDLKDMLEPTPQTTGSGTPVPSAAPASP